MLGPASGGGWPPTGPADGPTRRSGVLLRRHPRWKHTTPNTRRLVWISRAANGAPGRIRTCVERIRSPSPNPLGHGGWPGLFLTELNPIPRTSAISRPALGKYVYAGRAILSPSIEQMSRTTPEGTAEARRIRARMMIEVAEGRHGSTATTFDALLNEWLAHIEAVGRSPKTLAENRRKIESDVRPALGQIRLDRLTTHQLDPWYPSLVGSGTSPATVMHTTGSSRRRSTKPRGGGGFDTVLFD